MRLAEVRDSLWACSRMNKLVVIELVRKKDLSVVVALVTVFVMGAIVFRMAGIKDEATATFVLNTGLTLVHYAVHTLIILLACRQLPDEIERRTIYPLLARPVTRGSVVVSRVLAVAACGMALWLALALLCWLVSPKRPGLDPALLGQVSILAFASIGMATSIAVLLSLLLSRYLAATFSLSLFFFSGVALKAINQRAGGEFWGWLFTYVPDFSRLNLITRYTDGIPRMTFVDFAATGVYGAMVSAVCLYVAIVLFSRKSL